RQSQIRLDLQLSVRLDDDRQPTALHTQVQVQRITPSERAVNLASPVLTTAPVTLDLHALAFDNGANLKLLEAHGQLAPRDLGIAQHQLAIDKWLLQAARQFAPSIQLPAQPLDLTNEGPDDG